MSRALRVIRVSYDDPRWDPFVRAAQSSTFCHLSGWGRIATEVLGREFVGLAAVDEQDRWQGLLPLVRVKAPLVGHSLVSVPYLNYGGPLGTDTAREFLVRAAIEEARSSGAGKLQIRSRENPPPGMKVLDHKIIVLLDLPPDPDTLWNGFTSKLRTKVRKPEKLGMKLVFGNDQLDSFYRVFSRNMRDLGTPVYSRSFFQAIADNFDEVIFGAVYHEGQVVAAGCGFLWGTEYEMTWGAANRDFNALLPNMTLYWGYMQEVIRRGGTVFNFGRSTPNGGTHVFKKQWGSVDAPLPWAEWRPGVQESDTGSGSPGGIFQLASAAWKKLPLPVANRLGPPLAARLPWW
jgi:FemAB-related protein (PEP-CTERM system-associated)